MRFLKLLALFLTFSPFSPAKAFNWPWKPTKATSDDAQDAHAFLLHSAHELLDKSSLTPFESSILKTALQRLDTTQDTDGCMTKVMLELRGACEKLDVDETLKTSFAIACTQCELPRDANLFPSSCQSVNRGNVQVCLNDLTVNIAAWTSYVNAYTRVTITCLDIKFPLEKRLLGQLQGNLSLLQISMVEQFQRQYANWMELRTLQSDGLKLQKKHLEASLHHFAQAEKVEGELSLILSMLEALQSKFKQTESDWQHAVDVQQQAMAQASVALDALVEARIARMEHMLHKLDRHMNDVWKRAFRHVSDWDHHVHAINRNLTKALLLQELLFNQTNDTQESQQKLIKNYELHLLKSSQHLDHLSNITNVVSGRIGQSLELLNHMFSLPRLFSSVSLANRTMGGMYLLLARITRRRVWYAFAMIPVGFPDYSAHSLVIFPLLSLAKLLHGWRKPRQAMPPVALGIAAAVGETNSAINDS